MDRIAVFVDAGYLYAQGSAALVGAKQPRERIELNDLAIVEKLTLLAQEKAENLPLLRIYWYDGVSIFRGPGADQTRLASLDNIKVRFGFINSVGQQKGVDSLIITDLIDLARNSAISDALLLAGDEDVRIGVQVAQSYGVRVHLVGIAPCRGSQSVQLMQESDTTTEWDRAVVSSFLSVRPSPNAVTAQSVVSTPPAINVNVIPPEELMAVVQEVIDAIAEPGKIAVGQYLLGNRGIPPEYDRQILEAGRTKHGRPLEETEKRYVRMKFRELFLAKSGNGSTSNGG